MHTDDIVMAGPGGFDLPAVHPGEVLAEELAARRLSAQALALAIRVPANRVTEIVAGRRRISAETALRLGRYFGTGPQLWMSLQSAHDLAIARERHGDRIDREVAEA
ncbi:HigA family addiction module antitoxin [uncultured Alsobacter sp.]|uniref:HigA family addiction module antitoxin n=1 Tax=uncultured Alsobacter sp. TaxID=1748258 RepID=UPI0025FA686A|nr:HigA family addiction module antitoxin [uncultured Alsobacter sp.]